MLQAVIFDMDDTLIHWTGETIDWDKLERKHLIDVHTYITQAIHPALDFDTFVDTMLRRSQTAWLGANDSLVAPSLAQELIGALVDCGVPGDQIDQRACLDAYGWGKLPGTEIFPEVPGVLADLRARGLRLGVLTNAYAPMWMRDVELAEIGIDPAWFDVLRAIL